ncbi:hypothetical protein PIB30_014296, partial [Stylosanthes scabra]|nr:hypothetical protein [Stylosanthes scabra]
RHPCSVVSAGSLFEGEGVPLGLLAALVGLDATGSSGGTGPVHAASSACTSAASSSNGISLHQCRRFFQRHPPDAI